MTPITISQITKANEKNKLTNRSNKLNKNKSITDSTLKKQTPQCNQSVYIFGDYEKKDSCLRSRK